MLCIVMNASLHEPSESRMALKFSHKMNKDLKQNFWESRQSSTAWGSRIFWAEHLPGSGLLPGEPASMNAHSRTLKHRAVSQPTYCAWTLGGETQLPGRPLDLNNKTPMRSCEGTENGRWTSPIEGRGLHLLLNRVAAVS